MSPCGSDHIFISRRRHEMAGVWPLRIPGATWSERMIVATFRLDRTRPFLLIVRTGRIVTAHDLHPGVDMDEYRRIHGVSSI